MAAARWPWQIILEMRACRRRATRQWARRIAEPSMQTCRPQRPRALQPRGKCENGWRSGPYVLAATRWPWQIVQDMQACCRRATRQWARRSGANHADLEAAAPTLLATARQVRKRLAFWALRLGGRALALADRPRHASMSPARDAPKGTENRGANRADLEAAVHTRFATARQVRKRFTGRSVYKDMHFGHGAASASYRILVIWISTCYQLELMGPWLQVLAPSGCYEL